MEARFHGGQNMRRCPFDAKAQISGDAEMNTVTSGLYGALDLGTNACRMLIARPRGDKFQVIDSFSKSVQLGRGLEKSGRLSQAGIRRTVAALKVCRNKMQSHNVTRARLVATEACRRAANSEDFLRKVLRETGLQLEIIESEEEARLAVISCAPLVADDTRQLLVIDIGGGSTELVWIDLTDVEERQRSAAIMGMNRQRKSGVRHGRYLGARVIDWISVPVGVVTLTEQFSDVKEDGAQFALMSCYFEDHLESFVPYRDALDRESTDNFQIIGTSGTVTTVAASHLGLDRYERSKVDGLVLSGREVDAVIRQYMNLGPSGRRNDPRIGRERQFLIMSGVAILQTLLRIWPTDCLSVADRGLREGLLYEQMTADGALGGINH